MFQNLPGFRAFYPDECAQRNFVFQTWREAARRFGFSEFDAPTLEPLELYIEKSGPEIVDQLFNFEDRGERKVALRPEMTPSLARMVGAKANSMRRPIKWFCIGENFRYERPQKGRLRSFYQFNADILGEAGIGADAEAIALLIDSLQAFGLHSEDFCIRLSDRTLWMHYFESLKLEKDTIQFLLGLIDKWERESPEKRLERAKEHLGDATEDLLASIERFLSVRSLDALKQFLEESGIQSEALDTRLTEWDALLAKLEQMGKSAFIRVDLSIVRGLAYYTGFVFEAFQVRGKARALAGGGRYDHLVKQLGYTDLAAVGFGIGDVTLQDLLTELGKMPELDQSPDYYLIADSDHAGVQEEILRTVTQLRTNGFRVEYALKNAKPNKQLKVATDMGAKKILLFGIDGISQKNPATGETQTFSR